VKGSRWLPWVVVALLAFGAYPVVDTVTQDAATDAPEIPLPAGPNPGWSDTREALAALEVKGRAPKTGFDREAFGPAWSDNVDVAGGHNGCDTRNDLLRRDLTAVQLKPGTRGCVVLSGSLTDPYTGLHLDFRRGASTVDIDHVVALGDAWQKGAQQWTPERRRDFANDPGNLLAVSASANRSKGDADAATWLPSRGAARCDYARRQVEVKARYRLWVTAAERDALERILGGCRSEPAA
jgi:hypothetical protein